MRILQINAVNGIRSTGRICTEIADFLNNNGHEGYVAYSSGTPYKKGYLIGTIFEKKMHALLSRILGTQAYFSKSGTKKLLEHIENIHPDVVHLHNLHSNYINLKLLLTYLAEKDIPTVLTLHDCWFYTGKCCHYTANKCFKWQWQTGCFNCPRLRQDNPIWILDRTKKMYIDKREWLGKIRRLAVAGVSEWITNEAKKSFLSSAKIITKIYNWIDLDVFHPVETSGLRRKMGFENKFVILGVASNWSNAKGLDNFIRLAKKIENDIIIVLVGNINGNIALPENILHIKETHNVSELVKYYSMADIFVHLSLEETFGKVTAEALACGTPAIVYNSTANPELIGTHCGYVIEQDENNILLQKISEVKNNGKNSYSKHCIDFALKNFNMNARINDYIKLYKKISEKIGISL